MPEKLMEYLAKEYGIRSIEDLNKQIESYDGLDISIFVSQERKNYDKGHVEKSS